MFSKNHSVSESQLREKAQQLLSKMALRKNVMFLCGDWNLLREPIKYKRTYESHGSKRLCMAPVAFTDGTRGTVSRPVLIPHRVKGLK